ARIRLPKTPAMCEAPQFLVGDLLKAEGFTAVEYVPIDITNPSESKTLEHSVATGVLDIAFNFAAPAIIRVEAGDPITILAGVHPGCFELFGTGPVRAVRDLKGRRIAINRLQLAQHVYVSVILSYIGLSPRRDVEFVERPAAEGIRLFSERKVD